MSLNSLSVKLLISILLVFFSVFIFLFLHLRAYSSVSHFVCFHDLDKIGISPNLEKSGLCVDYVLDSFGRPAIVGEALWGACCAACPEGVGSN